MIATITSKWHKVRNGPLLGGAATFARWWWQELIGGLPSTWRSYLDQRPERLLARVREDRVLMWRDHNGGDELARFRLGDDLADRSMAVQGAISHFPDERPLSFLLLEQDQVLTKRLTLPAAAEENLRQVLAFEMDRHTPFKADDVYFDYRVIAKHADTRMLRVELIVTQRPLVDRLVGIMRDSGLALDGVDVCRDAEDDGGVLAVLGVNLLSRELRPRRNRRQLKLNLVLAGLFIGLLYVVMWQSLVAKENALEAFRARTEVAAAEAREVRLLSEQLDEARVAARFLSDKKRSQTIIIELIDEITRVLPDEVWLTRLQVAGDTVTMHGQAVQAQTLIERLQRSALLFEPALRGPITPDPQSGKDRFTIEAKTKPTQVEENGSVAT